MRLGYAEFRGPMQPLKRVLLQKDIECHGGTIVHKADFLTIISFKDANEFG